VEGLGMRLFVGIYLEADMLKEVIHFINLIDKNYRYLKWTSSENLHFTLKFFGEVPSSRLIDIKQALHQATMQNESFPFQLGEVGCFPAKGTPRVIWLGVTEGDKQLIKLANSIEAACFGHGFPKEDRPFSPHLTIARVKNDSPDFKFLAPSFQFTSKATLEGFSLIESQLYPTGPIYRQIEKFQLRVKN
jgi:2'-5' RNA ligase